MTGSMDEREAAESAAGEIQISLPMAIARMAISAESPVPIYEQICRTVRVAIVSGDLPVGTLLPTSRELAEVLGVGRNTVVAAYSRLVAEGFLVSKFRRGTRVALPPQSAGLAAAAQEENERSQKGVAPADPDVEISYQAQRALGPSEAAEGPSSVGINAPDPALYPRAILGRLLADSFGRAHFGEADADSEWRRFQDAVAAHFRQARGVACEPGQIIPVTGLSAAANLAAQLLLDPGHAVLVEDPAPEEVRAAFHAVNARLYPLPVDQNGPDLAAAKSPPPRLIYVSPSLNFPTGVQMSAERRVAVLEAAKASGAAIFECDGFGELLYTGIRLGAIQGMDRQNRVVYYASLKNTLGPHIRLGFLVVPHNLSDAFARMARRVGCAPEGFILSAIGSLIESNQYAVHVKKIRATYAQRLRAVVEACRTLWPEARLSEPHGGFHIAVHLGANVSAERIASTAASQGLAAAPLSRFSLRKDETNGLVIGFGAIPDRLVETVIGRLAGIAREDASAADRQVA